MAVNRPGAVSVCQRASWKEKSLSFSAINRFLLSFGGGKGADLFALANSSRAHSINRQRPSSSAYPGLCNVHSTPANSLLLYFPF